MRATIQIFVYLFCFLSSSIYARECGHFNLQKKFIPKYAKHFSIDYYDDFKIVHVDDDSYLLSSSQLNCSGNFQSVIKTPVSRVAFMSTTYLPALEILKKEETLKAFQGKQYIVSRAFDKNKLQELPYKLNPEGLIALKSDLIMGYASNLSEEKQKSVLKKLGLPVVLNKDFEETSPLARAEWLIFTSSFYNMEEMAMNVFNEIEKNYLHQKKENEKLIKTIVLVGSIENGFWTTCGGDSDLAQMIQDAGGELAYSRKSKETQRISLEELLKEKKKYDVWLTHNNWSSSKDRLDMMKKDQRYRYINAERIYNNNLITNESGATDFWETALQRPDLLLMDLSAVLHTEKFPAHKLKWYRRL